MPTSPSSTTSTPCRSDGLSHPPAAMALEFLSKGYPTPPTALDPFKDPATGPRVGGRRDRDGASLQSGLQSGPSQSDSLWGVRVAAQLLAHDSRPLDPGAGLAEGDVSGLLVEAAVGAHDHLLRWDVGERLTDAQGDLLGGLHVRVHHLHHPDAEVAPLSGGPVRQDVHLRHPRTRRLHVDLAPVDRLLALEELGQAGGIDLRIQAVELPGLAV